MIKALKNFIATLSMSLLVAVPLAGLATATVHADDITGSLCNGVNLNADPSSPDSTCASDTSGATGKVNSLIKTVINIFSIVVGVVSVIMIIIGGLKYITSGGDSGNVTGAKNTILYAIIGLVVVALAQIIVKFVLAKAVGSTSS